MFADPDLESVRKKTEFFSLMFVVIGCVSFVTMFLQVSVYLCHVYSFITPDNEYLNIFGC